MLGRRDRYVAYRAFVGEGTDVETEEFYNKGNVGSIFGDKAFRKSIHDDKENLQVSAELSQALSERPEMAQIVEAVTTVFKSDTAKIVRKRKGRPESNLARKMAIYCSQQLGDHSLKEIARYISLTNAGSVSPAINEIKLRLETGELSREYRRLEKILGIINKLDPYCVPSSPLIW